ncbi:MAG: protein translocase subunit SecD [Pirellulaceae bacterium]|nr:protein translocase subunit SecD [Pirellulaceae bacterium]
MDGLSIAWMLAQQAQNTTPIAPTWMENLQSFGSMLAILAAVFVLPFVFGRMVARALKMSDYGGKIGLVLAPIVASVLIIWTTPLRYGPDIIGGTNLIYELDKKAAVVEAGRAPIKAATLVPRLAQRLNPSGTKEIMIRPSGDDQIEIVVPNVDQMEVNAIKRIIQEAGILNFRIVANQTDHQSIIQLARKQAASEDGYLRLTKEVYDGEGNERPVVGLWQAVGRDEKAKEGIFPYKSADTRDILRDHKTGQIIENIPSFERPLEFEKWLLAKGVNDVDMLLALERGGKRFVEVTGDDLQTARRAMSKSGFPEVEFAMKSAGAKRLSDLTYANRPDPSGFKRRLAIVLDEKVLSAPNLNQPISSSGVIQGNFTRAEVDFLVNILESGSLPAALNKTPISENQVGAAMGQDAIRRAFEACMYSLAFTIGFILIYYRFSGVVASMALLINLLLILAGMIIIQQPITLPGLAGLVLTVGMSVDANVLVFERIREEIAKKSTGRLAIRNGFERAWTTIFDSNFTTLITALVLYWLGTDQVKGFAITLIIGLVISMFTAVFCSRVLFDIAERCKFVSYSMTDAIAFVRKRFLGDKDIDFMSMRFACYTISAILILIGIVATAFRGRNILDIDFNGGTSVIFSITKPLEVDKVREVIAKVFGKDEAGLPIQTSLTSVKLSGFEENAVFKLDTSIKSVADLTSRLTDGFTEENAGASLETYAVNATPAVALDSPVGAAATDAARSKRTLTFSTGNAKNSAKMDARELQDKIVAAATNAGSNLVPEQVNASPVDATDWTPESQVGYAEWNVEIPFDVATNDKITAQLSTELKKEPLWQTKNRIESRIAGQMQRDAILALVVSMLFIVAYIWFRFQKISYGLAAVVALVHDVFITLGCIALSHWLYEPLKVLMIEDFKISLTIVAAFLTIMGYSLNDTIVVFDRIREVKGKSPRLTSQMINLSVNQTLGRTLLTSSTTIVAIFLLYVFGGEGVHGFAFAMGIGIVVGTYSSIFVAAPILLWLASREQSTSRIKAA